MVVTFRSMKFPVGGMFMFTMHFLVENSTNTACTVNLKANGTTMKLLLWSNMVTTSINRFIVVPFARRCTRIYLFTTLVRGLIYIIG